MTLLVAWRILTYERGRSALAIAGIWTAVTLIFLQLGFYTAIPHGGMLIYDAMQFDILLASREYTFQARSQQFPRRRLYQAQALAEVADAMPFYHGSASWLNDERRLRRSVFVMAFRPDDRVFNVPSLNRQRHILRQPNTVLIDTFSRKFLGSQRTGRPVEIGGRNFTIGGRYDLGLGFVGLGVVVTSDLNFIRLFSDRSLREVNLGLINLTPGADVVSTVQKLRQLLPRDTRVFSREDLARHEIRHWVTRTSTGIVFGFGVMVAFIVGLVILSQTLSTQITRHLPEYATLKAIGYTNRFLGRVVIYQSVTMALIAFWPAFGGAILIYDITRGATMLPIYMTATRLLFVFVVTLAMSVGSSLLAIKAVRRADPVDLF